ncbi:MAG TPA: CoA-binding protein, partial [Firmicutes bacterium]|nr:CoA-binding protein [Bacillota bacterium]
VTISPGISTDSDFIEAFKSTIVFETLSGIARGHKKLVHPEKISDILERFHALVWRFSQLNPDARFWLTECEINPFLAGDGGLVPVDGLLRFSLPEIPVPDSPLDKIENLLKPGNIAVIGVSAKGMNLGRVILRNLLDGNFTPDKLAIVKDNDGEIDGVKCYPSIAELQSKFDMIVLSIDANQVPGAVREIVEHEKAESIILITGGMGEKSGAESLEDELRRVLIESRKRPDCGPVMVGGNSLGIISRPGGYDTMFVPPTKLPKNPELSIGGNIAFISQSGAYIITRMNKLGGFVPRYAISTGNQVDLGIADFLEYLATDDELKVFACYIEGFKPSEGLKFAEAASKITSTGRDVIVYKVGRSSEGRKAASGHTAAIAGDWDVADAVLSRAGCMVAESFDEFTSLLMLSSMLAGRDVGNGRIGAVSNAGYETVGMADNLRGDGYELKLAVLSDETRQHLMKVLEQFRLKELQDIRNPMDVTPMAVDRAHVEIIRAFASDPNVGILIHACVPLSPVMKTREPGGPDSEGIAHPESFTQLLINAFRTEIKKPLVVVIDSGSLYDPMVAMFMDAGIPVFRSADEAVRVIGRWACKGRACPSK